MEQNIGGGDGRLDFNEERKEEARLQGVKV